MNEKMNIEKNSNTLKVYMFTVQGGPVAVHLAEDFKAIMAYTDEEAINMVRKDYPAGIVITIKERARVEVKKIVDAINLQPLSPQDLKIVVTPPPTREKTMQDFVYGMMLVADKFVTNKRDQASLKRIINKIKPHEDTPAPTTKENLA